MSLIKLLIELGPSEEGKSCDVWIAKIGDVKDIYEVGVPEIGYIIWDAETMNVVDGTPNLLKMINEHYNKVVTQEGHALFTEE